MSTLETLRAERQAWYDAMRWAPHEIKALPWRGMQDWPQMGLSIRTILERQEKACQEYRRICEALGRLV